MFNLCKLVEQYRLIVVDIDNTLFNYTLAHTLALKNVLAKYQINSRDYDLARREIHSRNLSANQHKKELYFKVICENNGLHFSKARDMFELYTNSFIENLKVDKTLFNFLSYAKDLNKNVIAITNFYFIEQINKLKKAKLDHLIDYLVCSEEFELEKPNNALIDRALKLVNERIEERDVLVIGDSDIDESLAYAWGGGEILSL